LLDYVGYSDRHYNKVDKVSGERLINADEIVKLSNQSIQTGDQDLTPYETILQVDTKDAKLAEAKLYADGLITQIVNGSRGC
jgi:hypothetical protein